MSYFILTVIAAVLGVQLYATFYFISTVIAAVLGVQIYVTFYFISIAIADVMRIQLYVTIILFQANSFTEKLVTFMVHRETFQVWDELKILTFRSSISRFSYEKASKSEINFRTKLNFEKYSALESRRKCCSYLFTILTLMHFSSQ